MLALVAVVFLVAVVAFLVVLGFSAFSGFSAAFLVVEVFLAGALTDEVFYSEVKKINS